MRMSRFFSFRCNIRLNIFVNIAFNDLFQCLWVNKFPSVNTQTEYVFSPDGNGNFFQCLHLKNIKNRACQR